MRKIKTNTHLPLKNCKTIMVDTNRMCFEEIGQDACGNYILHKSHEVRMGSGYGEESEYYFLDPIDIERYKLNK